MSDVKRKIALVGAAAAAALLTYAVLPHDLGEPARRAVSIGVLAAVLWSFEVVPLFATSLAVVALEIVLLSGAKGAHGQSIRFTHFLEPFASGTIILFLGGFLLAAAAGKHGLDRAIASRLLKPFLARPLWLVAAITFIGGFMGMWMSNTAAAAMMLAMVAPLLRDPKVDARLAAAVALACAFGPSLGSFATPIATPPNAIAMAQLRAQGMDISFLRWMLFGVPLTLVMLTIASVAICVATRPASTGSIEPIQAPERLSWQGWATAAAIVAAMAGWLTGPLHGLDDCVPALIAAALLCVLGVIDAKDLRELEWSVLILIWGGLALGQALALTGVLEYVAALPVLQQTGLALACVIAVLGITLSTFLSNTATANILVPLAIGLTTAKDPRLALVAALSVSFGLALPISSPPNALAFATGKLQSKHLLLAGGIISIVGVGAMLVGYRWVLPWALR